MKKMKGIVTDVSDFTSDERWLFIIQDDYSVKYFVMDELFYRKNRMKSPVSKRELDSLFANMEIEFYFDRIEGLNIITRIHW